MRVTDYDKLQLKLREYADRKAFNGEVELANGILKAKCFIDQECTAIEEQQLNNGWIPASERLPQLPDGKSFMPLNATILAPSGLRNTVQMTWELKRGKPTWCYLGAVSDWNVIAWQPLPEPWEGEEE